MILDQSVPVEAWDPLCDPKNFGILIERYLVSASNNLTMRLYKQPQKSGIYSVIIFLEKYKDEEAQFIKAKHDPIISEELYYKVQDVLHGRKRNTYRLKVVSNASLPLRGFLLCPECGKILTGSASKGRSKYYSYYHCFDGCTCRYSADDVNDCLIYELKKYTPARRQ